MLRSCIVRQRKRRTSFPGGSEALFDKTHEVRMLSDVVKTFFYMIVNKVNGKTQNAGAQETKYGFHGVVVLHVNHQ